VKNNFKESIIYQILTLGFLTYMAEGILY